MFSVVFLVAARYWRGPQWSNIIALYFAFWIINAAFCHPFSDDHLTPYSNGGHGSRRSVEDVQELQDFLWRNRSYEVFVKPPAKKLTSNTVKYEFRKYADTTDNQKYLVGTIAYIDNPLYTFSVLEPRSAGTCQKTKSRLFGTRSTVLDTVRNRKRGCKLAANGGYFSMTTGDCYGNIVSDGKIVQTSPNVTNANFGIRSDGSIVVGYIPNEEVSSDENPFKHLIAGVIWLVRNGSNYVNQSMEVESNVHEDTGSMETFVNVMSARTAIGHDSAGRLVMAQVEGQTGKRGATLHEFANLLIEHDVVNAINMDGGGSNTLIMDGVLINYPSDHCPGQPEYRCSREVSTVLCVHDVECPEPDCSGHGNCSFGTCTCSNPWYGSKCDMVNCSRTSCNGHGSCSKGSCSCNPGWGGPLCSESCPFGWYGPGCLQRCWCFGNSVCDPLNGKCVCRPGHKGRGCFETCSPGKYGVDCLQTCSNCSGHGVCSPGDGSCICQQGWVGAICNITQLSNNSHTISSVTAVDKHTITSTRELLHASLSHSLMTSTLPLQPSLQTSKTAVTKISESPWVIVTVAVVLTIALGTLLLHALLCLYSRRQPRVDKDLLLLPPAAKNDHTATTSGRKLRKKRPRSQHLADYVESSSDCTL